MKLSTRLKVIGITVALAALVLGGVSSINRPPEPTIIYSTPQPVEKIEVIEQSSSQTTDEIKPVAPVVPVAPDTDIVEDSLPAPTVDNNEDQEEVAMFDGCRADQIVYTIHLNYSEEKWNEMKSDGIYGGSRIPVQSHTLYRHPTLGDYCFVN